VRDHPREICLGEFDERLDARRAVAIGQVQDVERDRRRAPARHRVGLSDLLAPRVLV
jgi:hypothetical protein